MKRSSLKKKRKAKVPLLLNEETHTYYNPDKEDIKYISVSKILEHISPTFDPNGIIAQKIASRDGVSVEEILAKWKKISVESLIRGKKIHSVLENYIKNKKYPDDTQYEDLIDSFLDFNLKGKLVSEEKLSDDNHGIAGTIDLQEETKKHLNIFDFKTNKEIEFSSKYNEKMLHPITHLDNCSYNRYAIQLSFYAWLKENKGYNIGKLGLIWITSKYKMIMYPVPYMRETVERIVDYIDGQDL